MPDQPVAPVRPMFARNELHQIALDFSRVFVFRQAEPLRQTDHVRVYHDAVVLMKRVAQYDIRRLATNAGQGA